MACRARGWALPGPLAPGSSVNRPLRILLRAAAEISVVGSYSRLGYELAAPDFDPRALDVDLRGKVAVVTGASTGLGRAVALALGKRQAHVVLVARSRDRLEEVAARIRSDGGSAAVEPTDVAELPQVAGLASRLLQQHAAIDILVQNAGVLLPRRELTAAGHERTFATNVLGPFLLQRRLDPVLRAAKAARVVHVTSGGMYSQRLNLDRLRGDFEPWDGVVAYAQTKRAQVLLNERWAAEYAGSAVTSNAMHPGWADTPGVETSLPAFYRKMHALLRTAEQGADTAIWLAASPEVAGMSGALWLDRRKRRTHVFPHTRSGDALAGDLWGLCCQETSESAIVSV